MLDSFNRYMVECELIITEQVMNSTSVLIDTWWNVNRYYRNETWGNSKVLIDTWWNVNLITMFSFCFEQIVLIDTWWNVNYDVYEIEELATGFNRYMVECESLKS